MKERLSNSYTTATSMPKRGCPPFELDKVLRSEDFETLARVCKSSPNSQVTVVLGENARHFFSCIFSEGEGSNPVANFFCKREKNGREREIKNAEEFGNEKRSEERRARKNRRLDPKLVSGKKRLDFKDV